MTYEVVLAPAVAQRLTDELPEAVARACCEFLLKPLAGNPRKAGIRHAAPHDSLWRARRGDYRVRYRIDETSSRVYVLDLSHRLEATAAR